LTVAKTGHLCRTLSQGRARGQGCNRTCALHLPKAELEVSVATGRMAPPASDNRASVRDPFKGRVRVAAEPAHSTFPEQGSRSVLPQGEWHPQSRRLKTGHLRNAPSQGRARGQSCNRTCALPVTFPEQSSRSVVLQGEWRHGCALHLPKALLEVGVATGPDGPNRFWAARARRKGSTGRAVAGLVSRYCPRVPHPHPQKSKGVA